MAIINGKYMRGTLGPAVMKEQGGKQLIASKKRKGQYKQSEATQKASQTFASASLLTTLIRSKFSSLTNRFEDGNLNSRLISGVCDALYDARDADGYTFTEYSFENLSGLDFNIKSPVIKTLRIKPIVKQSGESLTITLPKLEISKHFIFPEKSTDCKITVRITLYRLKDSKMNRNKIEQSLYVQHSQEILTPHTFSFGIPEDCLCLAGLFLQFYHSSDEFKILDNDKDFNPSCIVASFYRIELTKPHDEKEWSLIPKFKLK